MADKQPQLNGAYYGPSIPPSEPPRHHSHGCRRCCCCLFSCFLTIVVIVVVAFLVFWVVVQPRDFRFHVAEARLKQFNYTDNTLHYNLVLNFTARNPNKRLNIYYDKVEGHVSYDGVRFGSADVVTWQNSFRQFAKSTDSMSAVFAGQRVRAFDRDQAKDFDEDKKNGVFDINVRLYFIIRFRLGDVIGSDTKAKAKCELEIPFGSEGRTAVGVNAAASVPAKERLRTRCCYCLSQTLWVLLVLIIVLVMLVILVLYIIITPRSFKFHVTEARLAQFDYTANNTLLRYNLVLNITAQNPNKKLKIYYDVVQAHALYKGVRFSTTDVDMPWRSYLQDKKGTDRFSAIFSGQRLMVLDPNQVSEFRQDGIFPIDIKIRFRIRFRLGNLISGHFNARATCELEVPLASSKGKTVAPFDPTKCQVDF
ncbi:NDR1/HIN1-like protein 10, partial [Mucuna pruriens]